MKGTVTDPTLDPRVVYLRWFVLETLLPLPMNARGSGAKLDAEALLELYRKAPRSHGDVSAKELGQAARHFAIEGAGERCLFWVNETLAEPATFGVSRDGREDAENLAAAYGGRLAALELVRERPDDFEEPGALATDLAYVQEQARELSMGAKVELELPESVMMKSDPPEDRGWASAPCAKRMKEELERATSTGYEGTEGKEIDVEASDLARTVRRVPPGPWEEKERETRRNALRWNVVYNAETGERIPGVRFAPSFRVGEDGQPECMGVSFVPFDEDPTRLKESK
jgi:hypothetical protein